MSNDSNILLTVVLSLFLVILVLAAWFAYRKLRHSRTSEKHQSHSSFDPDNIPLPVDEADVIAATLMPDRLTVGESTISMDYRLEIANKGTGHLLGLRLALDLHSAGSEQGDSRHLLLGPDLGRADLALIHQIGPREGKAVAGRIHLSLRDAHSIARDDTEVLLPLVRLRVVGAGTPVRRFAFVVGLPSERTRDLLLPVRLDEGPRIHTGIEARPID